MELDAADDWCWRLLWHDWCRYWWVTSGQTDCTVGRNPAAKGDVELYGWIGFAVTEAIALFALVVALIVLFV